MMKRKIIILSIALILLLVLVYIYIGFKDNQESDLNVYLERNGAQLVGFNDFKIINKNESSILAENGSGKVKIKIIENLNKEQAGEYILRQSALLEDIFEPRLPPYPEFLTKETGCKDEFLPIKKETNIGNYYLLYAGDRLGYGICSEDMINYKSSLGYFYCSQESILFKVEFFIPKNEGFIELENLAESFKCI